MRFWSTKHPDCADKGKRNLYAGAGTLLKHSFCWVITFGGTSAPVHLLYISFLSVIFDMSLCVAEFHGLGKEKKNSSWSGGSDS